MPPTIRRLRNSSTEMRRYRSRSSALWWVVNGPARERLQGRRFDLDEVALGEPFADREDDLVARDEQVPRLLVGDQVQLSVAVAGPRVPQPVVLVRRRAQRLRQQRHLGSLERELAALGDVDAPLDRDDVADVEVEDPVVGLLAERVDPDDDLDRGREVAQIEER